jgi:hypothetical protein
VYRHRGGCNELAVTDVPGARRSRRPGSKPVDRRGPPARLYLLRIGTGLWIQILGNSFQEIKDGPVVAFRNRRAPRCGKVASTMDEKSSSQVRCLQAVASNMAWAPTIIGTESRVKPCGPDVPVSDGQRPMSFGASPLASAAHLHRSGREPYTADEPSHERDGAVRQGGRAGAVGTARAAYVSEDGWVERSWSRLRPRPRADRTGRLRP